MTTYAIIGGSFDPVHLGHTAFAKDVLEQSDADQVVFMPVKLQPFKLETEMTPFTDRKRMLEIACEGDPRFTVSDLEYELEGISYTYRTLDEFKKRISPEDRVRFVTGSDSFVKLDIWKNAGELLSENSFIIGVRPGYPVAELERKRKEFRERFGTESYIINNERHDISSTAIRERARRELPLDNMVGKGVEDYIITHGLYRQKAGK